jgi:hypothetical protein
MGWVFFFDGTPVFLAFEEAIGACWIIYSSRVYGI